jgi:hypothetical protein
VLGSTGTLSAWIKFLATSPNFEIVASFNALSPYTGFTFQLYNRRLVLFTSDGIGGYVEADSDGAQMTVGDWHHVVATFSGGACTFYVDGAQHGNTKAVESIGNSSTELRIGLDTNSSPSRYFQGKMDEISIWNCAMNSTQIAELYNSGTPSDLSRHSLAANGVAWWRMGDADDNTTTVKDRFGSHHATTHGFGGSEISTDVPPDVREFNGNNSKYQAATSTVFDIERTDALTVLAWVRPADGGNVSGHGYTIVSKVEDLPRERVYHAYQLLTYVFCHASLSHLGFNLLILFCAVGLVPGAGDRLETYGLALRPIRRSRRPALGLRGYQVCVLPSYCRATSSPDRCQRSGIGYDLCRALGSGATPAAPRGTLLPDAARRIRGQLERCLGSPSCTAAGCLLGPYWWVLGGPVYGAFALSAETCRFAAAPLRALRAVYPLSAARAALLTQIVLGHSIELQRLAQCANKRISGRKVVAQLVAFGHEAGCLRIQRVDDFADVAALLCFQVRHSSPQHVDFFQAPSAFNHRGAMLDAKALVLFSQPLDFALLFHSVVLEVPQR